MLGRSRNKVEDLGGRDKRRLTSRERVTSYLYRTVSDLGLEVAVLRTLRATDYVVPRGGRNGYRGCGG